jgi:putative ABC transport system permease protein
VFNLALKNLLHEKGRFALGIIGVAFANMLIIFQMSMVRGTFSQVTNYIHQTDADIWVLQEGLSEVTSSTSFVSGSNIKKIEEIEGVERVTGLFIYYTSLKIKEEVANVVLVGFDTESRIGGPWKIHAGRSTIEDKEIIVDKTLARSEGLGVGDTVNVSGHELTVAGLSDETTAVASQYIFISKETVRRYLRLTHIYNCLLVGCNEGADIPQITEEISQLEGIEAFTKQELAENTLKFWGKFLIPLLTALTFISFLVGTTVIGIVVYNITLHKEKEYGILLALGAASRNIYETVLCQGIVLGAIGFAVGAALSLICIRIANMNIPGMTAWLDMRIVVMSIFLTALMTLISTMIPLRKILKIDPFEIFRG